jgi:purine-binding chemotaxis protein CheW
MTQVESAAAGKQTDVRDWTGLAREASRAYLAGAPAEDRHELLIVELASGEYAIPVERIREIVRVGAITRVPRTPDWLVGVVALRGEIVQVVDLRSRLGLPKVAATRAHRIVVIHGDEDGVAGLMVDAVKGVLRVRERELQPNQERDFRAVAWLAPRGDGFVSVLDLDRVVERPDD